MTLKVGGPLILVGAGKMGGALLTGWLDRGLNPDSIFILDPAPPEEVAALAKDKNIHLNAVSDGLPDAPAVMVLAVKPQVMDEVLPPLKPHMAEGTVVLSIAAGQTLASMERHLGSDTAIVRSMPNTPAAIGRGITVACANKHVSDSQKDSCDALLSAAGSVAWTNDEAALDPVTAVSGSGPAYVFLLAECLEEAGVEAGLDRDLARQLACETVSGAGELLRQSDLSAAQLRKNVTSPGGTTAAALKILMGEDGLQQLMTQAVKAATKRSRELSS
jgi:pyrroline-5-carboxylate reductase